MSSYGVGYLIDADGVHLLAISGDLLVYDGQILRRMFVCTCCTCSVIQNFGCSLLC